MKIRPICAAVVSIGTALLLLSGIRCAQAAEIKIVSPGAYEDIEGEGATIPDCCPPLRFQQVFPAADFAALGNQPHWIVGHTLRPDESQTNPVASHYPDIEVRLSTMPVGPPNLSLDFDDNLGSDVMQYYRGPLNLVADAASGPGPREFYNAELPAGVTPFLYDPSQGNLLFDLISWQGNSPSTRGDKVPGIRTSLYAFNPLVATKGNQDAASIFRFTFVPVTPGDYNLNGTVDAADYTVWRDGLGTTYTPADYDVWRANFGQTIGSGAALPSADPLSIAVPEPVAWVMLLTGMLAIFSRRSERPPSPALLCVGPATVSTI